MASSVAIGVPTEVLVAPCGFDRALTASGFGGEFTASDVAAALLRGLAASGQPARVPSAGEAVPTVSEIRAARALIVGTGRLDRAAVISSPLSAIATAARQSGVPCHAVVGCNQLDLFDTRILDLQLVIEATTLAEIEAAGAEVGAAMQADLARGA